MSTGITQGSQGISLRNPADGGPINASVSGNSIGWMDGVPTSGYAAVGISVEDAFNVSITGNTVSDFNRGIRLFGLGDDVKRVVISSNRIAGCINGIIYERTGTFIIADTVILGNILSGCTNYYPTQFQPAASQRAANLPTY